MQTKRIGGADLAALALFLFCVVFTVWFSYGESFPTDYWFFLSSGREIAENGVPRVNPFSVEPGLGIVVQQWLWDVGAYILYSAGGFNLALAPVCALAVSAIALALAACRVFSGGRAALWQELSLCSLFAAGALPWLCARPHIVTMNLMLAVLIVCERTAQDGREGRLALLPLVMVVEMQFHMSMAWILAFVCGVYCLPRSVTELKAVLSPAGAAAHVRERKRFILALVAMVCVMPINPYGVDGMMYLFNSIGAASYRGLIFEMRPLWVSGVDWMVAVHLFAFPLIAVICVRRGGKVRPDLAFLFACCAAAEVMQVRSGWIPCVAGVGLAASSVKGESRPGREARAAASVAFAAAAAVGIGLAAAQAISPLPDSSAKFTMQDTYIEPLLEEVEGDFGSKDAVVFCSRWVDFNYLEWRGWKVLVDARPEIWEPKVSGSPKHLNQDFFDCVYAAGAGDGEAVERYVRGRGCEYVLSFEGSSEADPGYGEFFAGQGWLERMDGNGVYTLYRVVEK